MMSTKNIIPLLHNSTKLHKFCTISKLLGVVFFIAPVTYSSQQHNPKNGVINKSGGNNLCPTGVAVQSYEIEIYPKIGHHNTSKGNYT